MIEVVKKKNKNNGRLWWQEGNIIDDMGIEEYIKATKKLKGKIELRVNEIMMNEYMMPNMNLGNDHTDAFEDKKISLWRENGESMGTIPVAGTDSGDNIERKRCIKWLRGHANTITGAMHNCKDEHSASISLSGDLILHNLALEAKAAELKDPNEQVLRVLDYSRNSRHLLVTAGDDGTLHLWDTTGRSPKVSWLKQHSAPTAGISFSSDDKIIASVGLDKKLYTYDPGTSNGPVVFYDICGKPQPLTVLRACSSSEMTSLLVAKPVFIDETTCKAETALLGDAVGDSILMPDPLPSVTSSSVSLSTAVSGSRRNSRSGPSAEASSLTVGGTGSVSRTQSLPSGEETPQRSYLRPGGPLARLHAPRSSYNFKDDMEVFSPLVDVQPITPSLDKLWDGHEGAKKDHLPIDKKPSSMLFPSSSRRFPYAEDGANEHSVFDWKSSSTSKQDDARSFALVGSTPSPSSKSEDSSITPPEACGGEKLSDKFALLRQPLNMPSRYGMSTSSGLTSSSMYSGLQDVSPEHLSSSFPSLSLGTKGILGSGNLDSSRTSSLTLTHREPRRTYADRISTTSGTSLSAGSPKTKKTGAETKEELLSNFLSRSDTSAVVEPEIPPAINKSSSMIKSYFNALSPPKPSLILAKYGFDKVRTVCAVLIETAKCPQPDPPQGSNFTLQLFQRTLEESLDSFQKSIHEDMRNLHIEILRQFHIQEKPVVCGISSLGYDHTEILGNTLEEIAGEKAGIFKYGVPAFTVPQPDEAMRVLEENASKLDVELPSRIQPGIDGFEAFCFTNYVSFICSTKVPLHVVPPLDASLLNGLKLGLEGEHQYMNAGLAVALSSTWLQRTSQLGINYLDTTIVPDRYTNSETSGDLVFYLDGAHSPESMEICARWFSLAIKEENQQETFDFQPPNSSGSSNGLPQRQHDGKIRKNSAQILLFNCMSVRDPQLLLPSLMKTCARHGVYFKKALFLPNASVYNKVGSHALPPTETQIDLSWQFALQRVWENLMLEISSLSKASCYFLNSLAGEAKNTDNASEDVKDDTELSARSCENSAVFSSLPLAIKWLRDSVQQNQSLRFQVLVTGSLHLIGDVLKIVKK
ncbi:hypothetical protein WN943_018011 [Citrus x changshan-huyou]